MSATHDPSSSESEEERDPHTQEVRRALIRAQLLAELVVPLSPSRESSSSASVILPDLNSSTRARDAGRRPASRALLSTSLSALESRSQPATYDYDRYEEMLGDSLTHAIHAAAGSTLQRRH